MLLQAEPMVTTMPAWVGPTMAISLAVIAIAVLALTLGVALLAMRVMGEIDERKKLFADVAGDVQATLESIRTFVADGERIVSLVRDEAGAFARTSRRLRREVNRGIDRVERRMVDLATLYDVVHAEVEDTALDVAAGLRRFRRGRTGIVGRMTRALLARR